MTAVTGNDPGDAPARPIRAIVVNYQSASVLPACVASLLADGAQQVVVVDNGHRRGPSDQAAETALRDAGLAVTWVAAGGNLGYGQAVNLGARSCGPGDLLVCNPDIVVRPGTVAALARDLADDPTTAIVGPQLKNLDGTIYPSARTFPSLTDAAGHGLVGLVWPDNPFSRRYRLLDWDHGQRRSVDWVSGACFLVRRQAWDGLDGFDPRYFMYMEDVDLCWRAGRQGWRVVYQPAGEVVHAQGVSADSRPYRMILAHHRSMLTFAWRTGRGRDRALFPLVAAGVAGRSVAACTAKWRDEQKAGSCGRVEGGVR
ncbi:MAG: glycosyltransferase family 2 protein [Actinomycetota bacterium]|nr:glycosyltransferase family 2 protein [Actinomycetota bacterium]